MFEGSAGIFFAQGGDGFERLAVDDLAFAKNGLVGFRGDWGKRFGSGTFFEERGGGGVGDFSALAELARLCPQTLDDLSRVSGVGASKLAKYGVNLARMHSAMFDKNGNTDLKKVAKTQEAVGQDAAFEEGVELVLDDIEQAAVQPLDQRQRDQVALRVRTTEAIRGVPHRHQVLQRLGPAPMSEGDQSTRDGRAHVDHFGALAGFVEQGDVADSGFAGARDGLDLAVGGFVQPDGFVFPLGDHGVANGLDRRLLGDLGERVPVIAGCAYDLHA